MNQTDEIRALLQRAVLKEQHKDKIVLRDFDQVMKYELNKANSNRKSNFLRMRKGK